MKTSIKGMGATYRAEIARPALSSPDLEPEIGSALVGIAYAVLFSVMICYVGLSLWHIAQ